MTLHRGADMQKELTRYTFLIRQSGYARDNPHQEYDKWVRYRATDAEAEAFAFALSEERRGAWVTIKRGDVSWQKRCHYLEF